MNSNLPKVIFVIDKKEKNKLFFGKNRRELSNNEYVAFIIHPSNQIEGLGLQQSLITDFQEKGLIQPGNVLIKNPYKDSYALATEAANTFAVDKHIIFTEICSYLGAKRVLVTEAKTISTSEIRTAKVSIEGKATAQEINITPINMERTEAEKIKMDFSLSTRFEGGNPNLDEANRCLEDNQLQNDQYIKSLIGLRQMENLALEQEMSLQLTQESKINFDIAASLFIKVPSLERINGISKYKYAVENLYTYSFKYKITF